MKTISEIKVAYKHLKLIRNYRESISERNPLAQKILNEIIESNSNEFINKLLKLNVGNFNKNIVTSSTEYISHIFDYVVEEVINTRIINKIEINFNKDENDMLTMSVIINDNFTKFTFNNIHKFKCKICADGMKSEFDFCASDKSNKKHKIQRILPFCFGE